MYREECIYFIYTLVATLHLFSQIRKVSSTSLLYWKFLDMRSDELYTLTSPSLTFATQTQRATYTRLNHPHSFRIPSVRSKSFGGELLLCGTKLSFLGRNRISLQGICPNTTKLSPKSRVKPLSFPHKSMNIIFCIFFRS